MTGRKYEKLINLFLYRPDPTKPIKGTTVLVVGIWNDWLDGRDSL